MIKEFIMDGIKIHTEGTPNPNALKFVVSKSLLDNGTASFTDQSQCTNSPLAKKLFNISSVREVLISKDFITILKDEKVSWESIYDQVLSIIQSHLESNEPIVINIVQTEKAFSNEIEKQIHEILDSQIRPAVASDGGDVIFDSYEDGTLRLHLQGSCSHCPSSIMTLKAGIETMLKKAIPEIKEVISV